MEVCKEWRRMFTKAEFKNNLMGCLEVFLFMPCGLERFSNERRDALRSFMIPLILLPVTLTIIMFLPDEAGAPLSVAVPIHFVRIILAVVLFLAAVYFLAKQFGREEYFYKFLNVSNWFNIIGFTLILPFVYGIFSGQDMVAFEAYAVFVTLVGYVYTAFVLTYCFKLPWQMGGFISIIGLAIDQNLFTVAHMVRDWAII